MKEDEGAKGPRGWSVMYKLFCMHPVVGREKEARPLPSTTIYHPPPPQANFCNILESFYSLQNYPLPGCLRNDRVRR